MKLLLKFKVEDIRLAFTTKCYTLGVWQSKGEHQHFGGQNCKELKTLFQLQGPSGAR